MKAKIGILAIALGISLMAAVSLTLTSCGPKEARSSITIKGSDTMVHLVSSWAEAFMNSNTGKEVSVTGGGSGTGIAALLNGTTDICAASRNMQDKEYKLAEDKGLDVKEFVVARDGIAVIVNPNNPVDSLSIEQIGKIYTGAYTNWSQVGGPDQPIQVLSRESSSGTYVFFQEHVLNKKDFTTSARLMPATSSIIQSTTADQWAIGYVGLGYGVEAGNAVKMLGIKDGADSPVVFPSEETVNSGEYSIARPLFLYTKGVPTGEIKSFLDFCLSKEGQKIVVETGYVAVN